MASPPSASSPPRRATSSAEALSSCKSKRKNTIKIGSDCTGLNAARLAFDYLGLEDQVVDTFGSDSDAA
eukprot:537637-Alexandrium_andersonii.AAC.1